MVFGDYGIHNCRLKQYTLLLTLVFLLQITQITSYPRHIFPKFHLRESITDNGLNSEMEAKHHNYDEMVKLLNELNAKYPKLTHKYSVGKSVQGRELWVMVVSDNPDRHEPGEPEFKYVANMHGNEVVGRELLLKLIETFCVQYGKSKRLTYLVDNTRMHFMPSMNPDGYEIASLDGGTDWLVGRNNANDVDLNRNFPDQFYPKDDETREPETNHTMNWIKSTPFMLSANIHGGSLVANYPYDDNPSGQTEYTASPDDDVFKKLALTYAFAHPTMHLDNPPWECKSVPPDHFVNGVTNGANWYNVAGGMQDYNYVHSDCLEITLELGCNKFPKREDLPRYWEENKHALVKFIEQIHKGLRGFVKSKDGTPIKGARIHIDDRSHVSHAGEAGDFWRILEPGSYDLSCEADGYLTATKKGVQVNSGAPTSVNFFMEKGVDSSSTSSSAAAPTLDMSPPESSSIPPNGQMPSLQPAPDGILQPENNDNQMDSSDMNGYTGFPLLSQIQSIDRQLLRSAAMQTNDGWQGDFDRFDSHPMDVRDNAQFRHSMPFANMDEVYLGHQYQHEPLKQYYLDTPRGFSDTQLMMNQLNLEHDDFFDHKKLLKKLFLREQLRERLMKMGQHHSLQKDIIDYYKFIKGNKNNAHFPANVEKMGGARNSDKRASRGSPLRRW